MYGGCSGRERDDLFISAGELFQILFESDLLVKTGAETPQKQENATL